MASRSVSDVVLTGTVEVPAVPALLASHWQREVAQHLALAPGDVEALNLAQYRTRANAPHYRRCLQAATDWAHGIGLPDVLAESHIALMPAGAPSTTTTARSTAIQRFATCF